MWSCITGGQPISTTDPLGNIMTFTCDAQRDRASVADPSGNITTRQTH